MLERKNQTMTELNPEVRMFRTREIDCNYSTSQNRTQCFRTKLSISLTEWRALLYNKMSLASSKHYLELRSEGGTRRHTSSDHIYSRSEHLFVLATNIASEI